MTDFASFAGQCQQRINNKLIQCLPDTDAPAERLCSAMRYSVLNGGKRIRPMLAYAAADAVGSINEATDAIAAAVELIHAYSLIHDDLPAMDNDDLRRGKPTCHIAFDEATAILAGDALQSLAFEQLTQLPDMDADTCLRLIRLLSVAAGAEGMVAGQAIDIEAADHALTLPELCHMHRKKTGALISASITMSAIAAGADKSQLNALEKFGHALGLAFQVQDDILDITSDTDTLGKKQGADEARNKPTFVSLLGLEQAKEKLSQLHCESLEALSGFDDKANHLRSIGNYIVSRNH